MERALAEQHHELRAVHLTGPAEQVVIREATAGKRELLVDAAELLPHRVRS